MTRTIFTSATIFLKTADEGGPAGDGFSGMQPSFTSWASPSRWTAPSPAVINSEAGILTIGIATSFLLDDHPIKHEILTDSGAELAYPFQYVTVETASMHDL